MRTLGLFAKQPRPGQVKTRLAASPEWAARVADAFVRDVVRRLATVSARRVLAFAPAGARPFFADLVGSTFTLVPQAEGDLGRRLTAFVTQEVAAGAERVVLVGTDSPTLPVELVERAFAGLEWADVVIGPATDGGYYLIGVAAPVPPRLFEAIAWSSSRVLVQTLERVVEAGRRLAVLPPWYDVDTPEDWQMLCGHLRALRAGGIDPGVPHTEALVREGTP